MKFEDLIIVQKWREYAGPKDECLETENAKVYKHCYICHPMRSVLLGEKVPR